ncbi:MAG: ADP-ribosylglycohydrolase family protein [Thermodesulfobacteriota bacterium]
MENARAMVLLSFAADALCLPAHWIYNTDELAERFGTVTGYMAAPPGSYHQGKNKGEFTHYGDQTLWLLEFLAGPGTFDPGAFFAFWRGKMEAYQGYKDHASKDTLANLDNGKAPAQAASLSTDLAGASRIAPLVYTLREAPPACAAACRQQTMLTHGNPQVIEAAGFFAEAALACLAGQRPSEALRQAAQAVGLSAGLCEKLSRGMKSREQDTLTAIKGFGQMCDISAAFPSVVHLLVRHEDDPARALMENVMAGGDSAARGMVAGMVLGAFHGFAGWPEKWTAELAAAPRIRELLERVDAIKTTQDR